MEDSGCSGTLLTTRGLTKSYSGVVVFDDFSFDLKKGEVHCVCGENGAGKSTFIKILSGAIHPDCGKIMIEDCVFESLTPALAQRLGIQTIYQEQYLVSDLTVAENIFLGHEIGSYGTFNSKKMFMEAEQLFDSINVEMDVRRYVVELGVAEKQFVQIAKALWQKTKILIMDEPTSSFSRNEINKLLKLIVEIAKKGVGIIFISHHLEEVFEIADRITVLRDGRKIASHLASEIDVNHLISEMVGRDTDMFYKREEIKPGEGVLEIKRFNKGGVIKDISFTMKQGEILGIAGMVGSGRTELARLLFGADRADSGNVFLNGTDITPKNPNEAVKRGMSMITEDRQISGLIMEQSVKNNISLAKLNKQKRVFMNLAKEAEEVKQYVDKLNVKTRNVHQVVKELSGGNQQKVVLSKWLFADSNIIIFDEPTQGIDIGAREEIYKLITQLAKDGKYIIMISSDMTEIIAMSDKVIIMRKGEITAELNKDEISEEQILRYSIGG